jgi:hypothetical protein
MGKLTVLLAFAAGLLGGVASRYLSPPSAFADSIPKELRAQRFVLVNEHGTVLGRLCEDPAGRPFFELFDANGQQIWTAGGKVPSRPLPLGK